MVRPRATWLEFVGLFAFRGFQTEQDECFEFTHPLQIQLCTSIPKGMPKLWRANYQTVGIC
jgi:hypothetical protein